MSNGKIKKRVLVAVDLQNDFIDCHKLGTPQASIAARASVKLIEKWKGLIVATQDTHDGDYLKTHEGSMLPVPHCLKGTEGWEIDRDVLYALNHQGAYFGAQEKPTFGDLYLPDLIARVADVKTSDGLEIYLIGLCTDICVISNALLLRAAFVNADVYVVSDCCAGSSEEKHRAALKVMESCHITPISSKEIKL